MSNRNFSRVHQRLVQPNQLWDDGKGVIRIMAVADGYALARRKGCMPFAVAVKDMDTWSIAPAGARP